MDILVDNEGSIRLHYTRLYGIKKLRIVLPNVVQKRGDEKV